VVRAISISWVMSLDILNGSTFHAKVTTGATTTAAGDGICLMTQIYVIPSSKISIET
jgi:hypothetical protein